MSDTEHDMPVGVERGNPVEIRPVLLRLGRATETGLARPDDGLGPV